MSARGSILFGCIVAQLLATVAAFQQPGFALQQQRQSSSSSSSGWGVVPSPSYLKSSSSLQSTTSPTTSKAGSAQGDDDDDDDDDINNNNNNNQSATESSTTSKDKFVEEDLKAALEDFENNKKKKNDKDDKKLSMPWSQNQEWALRDNLPKYTVMVPMTRGDGKNTASVVALWRTMLKEVPELAGYPIDFLQERHAEDQETTTSDNDETTTTFSSLLGGETPALLPYLEDYEFAAAGGISGKVYGIPGLADGARIETSAVTNIEVTLAKGFICTSDGSAAYELGRPKREAFTDVASSLEQTAKSGSFELLKTVSSVKVPSSADMEDADGMLVRLGASTGILLAGATAMNMLAHHLTVNVFWV
jgi:hypothetical protein